jgi:hypothetical protein
MKTLITILLVFVSDHPFAQSAGVKNILLIHGTFADGSGWEGVYKILTFKGYHVTIVQNSCSSLEEDVAAVHPGPDQRRHPAAGCIGPCLYG